MCNMSSEISKDGRECACVCACVYAAPSDILKILWDHVLSERLDVQLNGVFEWPWHAKMHGHWYESRAETPRLRIRTCCRRSKVWLSDDFQCVRINVKCEMKGYERIIHVPVGSRVGTRKLEMNQRWLICAQTSQCVWNCFEAAGIQPHTAIDRSRPACGD